MNYFFDYDIIILLIRCSFKSIEGIKFFYYEEAEARGNDR